MFDRPAPLRRFVRNDAGREGVGELLEWTTRTAQQWDFVIPVAEYSVVANLKGGDPEQDRAPVDRTGRLIARSPQTGPDAISSGSRAQPSVPTFVADIHRP